VAKQERNDRQAKLDAIRKQQKSAARRGNVMIIGVASALGLLIIAAAAWKPITDALDRRDFQAKELTSIGAKADVCGDIITKPADGVQDHVTPGTPIDYADVPPAFGQHYDTWESIDRKFYTDDRPDVGFLVHNLEHGYTILWYDETIADDDAAVAELRAIADKLAGTSNLRTKFKAVPWTSEDEAGKKFPNGQHVALTHWSAGGSGETDQSKFQGVWQFCSEPSGAALEKFMVAYPYMDSPEPNAG
jgi:hypothetical protein